MRKLKTASESDEARWLRAAIGAGPDEDVEIQTPQFERTPDMTTPGAPPEDFEALRQLDKAALKEMGCEPWDEPDAQGRVLMLFPGEWYGHIPDGMRLKSISGRELTFERGKSSRDIRFGVLGFGLTVRVKS